MELLTHPIIALLVVIGVLVTIHEAGHFLVGRWSGIAVESFSIGFGPAIFFKKIGDTTYKISILPFGGYVKFYGMIPSEKVPEGVTGKKFADASYLQRVATLAAGPLANLLLAVVVYAGMVASGIPQPLAIVGEVQPGSSAEKAGLMFRDRIAEIDGVKIKSWMEMRDLIAAAAGKTLKLSVMRGNETLSLQMIPDEVAGEDLLGRAKKIGRAGVSRGVVPSVVTVANQNSAAYRVGLRSGMRIQEVTTDTGEAKKVEFLPEFYELLMRAVSQKQGHLSVLAAPTHKDGSGDSNNAKSYSIPLASAYCEDCARDNAVQIARRLGITDAQLLIGDWQELGEQGIQKNDLITSWNGEPIDSFYKLIEIQEKNVTAIVDLGIIRDQQQLYLPIKLKSQERQLPSGRKEIFVLPVTTLGLPQEPEMAILQYNNPLEALWFGIKETSFQSAMIVKIVGMLFTGEVPLKALGGPIMIANAAKEAAQAGWLAFLGTLASISVNLAVFNAVPLPLFDGGQIVLATVETIRRRRLSEKALENYHKLGFALLMALIILATHNDVSRYWVAIVRSLTGSNH